MCDGTIEDFTPKPLEELCDELTYKAMTGDATLEERKELATKLYNKHKPLRD